MPERLSPQWKHERVHERAVRVPRRGVDDHAARLVDHDDVRVLIDDVERDVLGRERDFRGLGQLDAVGFARGGLAVLLHLGAAERDGPGLDEPLGLRAGEGVHITREESVDALAALQGFYIYYLAHLSENSARISSSVNSCAALSGFFADWGRLRVRGGRAHGGLGRGGGGRLRGAALPLGEGVRRVGPAGRLRVLRRAAGRARLLHRDARALGRALGGGAEGALAPRLAGGDAAGVPGALRVGCRRCGRGCPS